MNECFAVVGGVCVVDGAVVTAILCHNLTILQQQHMLKLLNKSQNLKFYQYNSRHKSFEVLHIFAVTLDSYTHTICLAAAILCYGSPIFCKQRHFHLFVSLRIRFQIYFDMISYVFVDFFFFLFLLLHHHHHRNDYFYCIAHTILLKKKKSMRLFSIRHARSTQQTSHTLFEKTKWSKRARLRRRHYNVWLSMFFFFSSSSFFPSLLVMRSVG